VRSHFRGSSAGISGFGQRAVVPATVTRGDWRGPERLLRFYISKLLILREFESRPLRQDFAMR
jgi:hypothetical protein